MAVDRLLPTDEARDVVELARQIADKTLAPIVDHHEKQETYPEGVFATLGEAGLRLVSGGTDNHLVLVDLTPLDITGQAAETALEKVGIVTNKNAIPFDTKPPRVTSGLRLGAPAITSRGFDEEAVKQVAGMIVKVLTNLDNQSVQKEVAGQVKELTSGFLVPGLDL